MGFNRNWLTYMQSEVSDHVDHRTDEVNMTHLAEDCCNHFGITDPEQMETVDELAFRVAQRHEARLRRVIRPGVGRFVNAQNSDSF